MKCTIVKIAVMALAVLIVACGAGPESGADLQDTRWALGALCFATTKRCSYGELWVETRARG